MLEQFFVMADRGGRVRGRAWTGVSVVNKSSNPPLRLVVSDSMTLLGADEAWTEEGR